MTRLPRGTETSCCQTGPALFCATVWDSGLLLAREEGITRLGALRAAVLSYHVTRIVSAQLLSEELR